MCCQEILLTYYTLSLLPGIQSPFLLQPFGLFLKAFDLSFYVGLLSFPGPPFILYD